MSPIHFCFGDVIPNHEVMSMRNGWFGGLTLWLDELWQT